VVDSKALEVLQEVGISVQCFMAHPSWVWTQGTPSGLSAGRLPPRGAFVSSVGGHVYSTVSALTFSYFQY